MSTQSKVVFLTLIAVMNLCQLSGQAQAEDSVENSTTKSEKPAKQPVERERPFITFDARIDEHVIILRKETRKESIAMLVSLDMYHHPGVFSSAISLGEFKSFDPKFDKRTIDRIFCNRRFLKVLAESQDQTDLSGAVLRDGLKSDIDEYLTQYELRFDSQKAYLDQGIRVDTFGFAVSDNSLDPLKTPAIKGMRLKVLSSILVLSQLRDRQAFETVLKISNLAIKQRDQLFADQDFSKGTKFSIIRSGSLYNKRILASALLSMSGKNELAKKYKWEEFKMVNYDAKATPYDYRVFRFAVRKIDYPPNDRIVRLIAPLTDEDFAALVKQFNE